MWRHRTRIDRVLTFGRGGDTGPYKAKGWAGPEEIHEWTVGPESQIVLTVDAPHGLFLEVSCGPCFTQRLTILANDTLVGECVLTHSGVYAWPAPPVSGALTLTFRHPDHRVPTGNGDPRPLAVSFRRLRLLVLAPPCDEPDLLRHGFESLGDNCEFGFIQRRQGDDPLGLLRWANIPIEAVVDGVDTAFDALEHGLEAIDSRPISIEWTMHSPRCQLRWHTFVSPDETGAEEIVRRQARIARFLSEKLMRDIAEAEKTFVIRRVTLLALHEVMPLFLALRRVGPARLLFVSADPARGGEVDEVIMGLFHGRVASFGDNADIPGTMRAEEWTAILDGVRQSARLAR